MLRILKFFLIITNVLGFNIIHNINYVNNKNLQRIYMNYDPLKGYDQKLTIIPSFQATIVVNNWINYLSEIEYDDNFDNNSNNNPEFIQKSIYDMKIFISINKIEKNTIIFAWSPNINLSKTNIAYIISGKIVKDQLQIYRIAQSPYYRDILLINSKDVIDDINNIVKQSPNISSINYDELHKYDNRYLLSWTLY